MAKSFFHNQYRNPEDYEEEYEVDKGWTAYSRLETQFREESKTRLDLRSYSNSRVLASFALFQYLHCATKATGCILIN